MQGIGLELTREGIISGGGGIPAPGKKVAISMLIAPLIRFLEGKWRGYRGKVGGTMARTIIPHDSWRNNGNVAVLNSARSRTSGTHRGNLVQTGQNVGLLKASQCEYTK